GDHAFEVRWNGDLLGLAEVTDTASATATLTVDPTLITGADRVELHAIDGDLAFVDAFELTYDRQARAFEDRLTLGSVDGGSVTSAGGFGSASVVGFEISNPLRPRVLSLTTVPDDGGYRALWQTRDGERFHLTTADGFRTPTSVIGDHPADLRTEPGTPIDYLVIAAPSLIDAASDLADYRAGRGLTTAVVSLDEVHDAFAGGLADPRAVRDYLSHLASTWTTPPRFVVLVGHGTYDYLDHWGFGDNLVPPLMDVQDGSLYPSDTAFADPDGDGVLDFALGRLPILDAAELQTYLAKVMAYEAGGDTAWDHRVLLLADQADAGGNFPVDNDALRALLPNGAEVIDVSLDDQPDVATARAMLFDALATGSAWTHFGGHGAVDRLAAEQLLASSDVPTLPNPGRPTILSAVSCTVGIHAVPGIDALAEDLVLAADRGAVAVVAPAWLSQNPRTRVLADRLFRQVFQLGTTTLGDAFRSAVASAAALGEPDAQLRAYQLIGDPALEVQWTPEPPLPCSVDCGGSG
ncbi:MAG: C25 family cysteine peptidase, partial [Acidobacteriota bacterium]